VLGDNKSLPLRLRRGKRVGNLVFRELHQHPSAVFKPQVRGGAPSWTLNQY
jgi:deoxycytidine triphosphate deaminase